MNIEKNIFSNKKDLLIMTSLLLAIFSIPFVEHLNSKFLILFLSIILFYSVKDKSSINNMKTVVMFSLFFFVSIIQIFNSDIIKWSDYMVRILPFFIIPLLISYFSNTTKVGIRKKSLNILLYSTFVQSLFLILFAIWRQYHYSPDFSNINWYFFTRYDFTDIIGIHPTYLGAFITFSIIIIMNNFIIDKIRKYDFVVLVVLIITLFMTGSRVAIVAFIFSTSIFLFYNRSFISRKMMLYMVVGIFILSILIFSLMPILYERIVEMTFGFVDNIKYAKYGNNLAFTGGLTPRFQMWDCCISSVNDNFLFGNGIGNDFTQLQECYLSKGYIEIYKEGFGPHSQYFSSLISGGIIKVGALLFTFIYSLIVGFKRKDYLYVAFVFIIIISSSTESFLDRQKGIVFYTLFNSVLFYFYESSQNDKENIK